MSKGRKAANRMRTKKWAVFGVLLCGIQPLWACSQPSFPDLQKLYIDKRYFELRDQLKHYDGQDPPELLFFRGAVDNIFNRLPSSIRHLEAYLGSGSQSKPVAWAKESYDLLADSYRKSFQYRKAAQINEKILILFGNELDADEKADHENEYRLWNALKDTPAQTVKLDGDSVLKMQRSRVPMTINGREVALTYDTGADLSVLIRSLAEEFGLELVDIPIKVGTITGQKIDAQVGVASEVQIGKVTIRHALFLVVRDEDFYIPEAKYQIQGVIGFPILEAMGEVTVTRTGEFIISNPPRTQGEQNLALTGFKPLIEGAYRGRRLSFVLDTGATKSDLWPPFFKAFGNDIRKGAELKTEKFRGAGSRREVRAYVADDLTITIAGREIRFRRIPIFMEYTTENSRSFFGNLGQDVVRQFDRVTINFQSMSVMFD
jgi:hypothetical protein